MAQNYAKKLVQMRAYAKTPAGQASKKASQAKWLVRRKAGLIEDKPMIVKTQALTAAINNWR